jgi:transcriptional regulator with XRE-family HTH domain
MMAPNHKCEWTLATVDKPYHFTESGLPDVQLAGIRYIQCKECGRKAAEIPALKQLLQLIARSLVGRGGPLTGEEIRFLRKRIGKKQAEFAAEIGIDPATLSRMETGAQPITETNDKFIRMYYALMSDDSELRKPVQEAFRKLTESFSPPKKKPAIRAEMSDSRWQSPKAA